MLATWGQDIVRELIGSVKLLRVSRHPSFIAPKSQDGDGSTPGRKQCSINATRRSDEILDIFQFANDMQVKMRLIGAFFLHVFAIGLSRASSECIGGRLRPFLCTELSNGEHCARKETVT